MAKVTQEEKTLSEKKIPVPNHPEHEENYLKKQAYRRSKEDRYEAGKKMRFLCSHKSHTELEARDRPNPVDILTATGPLRIQEFLPIRYGRMSVSPFTFYRGAASVMASDLSRTPTTGYYVQACGDCHLSNFGGFATDDRRILFDVNDFDETYPAPWEWDLKRLAASFAIACQNNGFSADKTHAIVRYLVKSYNQQMHKLAEMPVLEAWSYVMDYDDLINSFKDKKLEKKLKKGLEKAEKLNGTQELAKLTHMSRGKPVIIDRPPLIFHASQQSHPGFTDHMHRFLKKYQSTLPIDRRYLLDRYEYYDLAIKIVGVGSVGTLCSVVLLFAGENDPLFLQIKEALPSSLEPYVKQRKFSSQGERVVQGQRIMQTAGDIFLGHAIDDDLTGRHLYVRKLHDVKVKPPVEEFDANDMKDYARCCGWALAVAHGRSSDPAIIAGYMGKGKEFAEALADFSFAYADLNLRDYNALLNAIKAKTIPARLDIEH